MIAALLLGLGAVMFADTENGTRVSISGDKYEMNWALAVGDYPWIEESDTWGKVTFDDRGKNGIVVEREAYQDGEDEIERFTFTNRGEKPAELKNVRVKIPFNDNYPAAKTCLTRRCNAHFWPGGEDGWVVATRMGGEAPHLALMMTKGSFDGYAVDKRGREFGSSNFRGVFSLVTNDRTLAPSESYVLEWRLFVHDGWDDFKAKFIARGGKWHEDDRYVLEVGEKGFDRKGVFRRGGCEYFVTDDFDTILKRRLDFILDRQQYDDPGDIRDGAFLPYDNETDSQYRDWLESRRSYDRDEGRERIGMGVLLAEAMRDKGYSHPRAKEALEKYVRFVRRALQNNDFKTFSEVERPKHRIYNYAWTTRLYFDAYEATGNAEYLDWAYATAMATFRYGGYKFYMIDFPIVQSIEVLRKARRDGDAESLLAELRKWADEIAEIGLDFPKSEVNYEQSIVVPAANTLAEMYIVTRDGKYRAAAEKMLPAVESFNGHQPSAFLNDIAIRHWDGYWFGKREMFGDTFPHYWSAITADFFRNWASITGEKRYLERARNICRGNLALFTGEGRAGCAYLYPDQVNGERGKFLDPMANDQDWALVFAIRQGLFNMNGDKLSENVVR